MSLDQWVAFIAALAGALAGVGALLDTTNNPFLRPFLILTCTTLLALSVILALSTVSFFNSATPSPPSPPSSTSPTFSPPVPTPTISMPSSNVPAAFIQLSLEVPAPLHATLYFGELNAILDSLSGQVNFRTIEDYRQAHPNACVETIVTTNVPGTTGAIYAVGLGQGWTAAEDAPGQRIAPPDANLHQQLVIPPINAVNGDTWTGSALVQGNGISARSGRYTLSLISRNGNSQTWKVGNKMAQCVF
jgi:hypothetical protein